MPPYSRSCTSWINRAIVIHSEDPITVVVTVDANGIINTRQLNHLQMERILLLSHLKIRTEQQIQPHLNLLYQAQQAEN